MVLIRRGEEEVSCWRCVVFGSSGVEVDVAWRGVWHVVWGYVERVLCGVWSGGSIWMRLSVVLCE